MNPLENVTVEQIIKVNETTIVLVVDLTKHIHLVHPGIVASAMAQYMARYQNANAWAAEFVGNMLYITISGKIDWTRL